MVSWLLTCNLLNIMCWFIPNLWLFPLPEAPYLPYYYDEDFLSIRDGGQVYYAMPMAASFESDSFDSAPRPEMALVTTTNKGVGGMGLAGPPAPQGAFNRGGSAPEPKPIEIRKEFPETWLFDSLEFDDR